MGPRAFRRQGKMPALHLVEARSNAVIDVPPAPVNQLPHQRLSSPRMAPSPFAAVGACVQCNPFCCVSCWRITYADLEALPAPPWHGGCLSSPLKNVGHVSNVPVFPANRTLETCATEYFNKSHVGNVRHRVFQRAVRGLRPENLTRFVSQPWE